MIPMKRIAILGAGGHATVVADALRQVYGNDCIAAVLDDDAKLWGQPFENVTITGPLRAIADAPVDGAIIAIGDNCARRRAYEWLVTTQIPLVNVIHPSAVIAEGVRLGRGVAAFANVVVNVGAQIGDNVILNTACTVDHDCVIGAHAHIAPGVHLAGNVTVGEGTLIGIGSAAIPGMTIGQWTIIGAGAVIVNPIPDHATALGVPARVTETRA